MKRFVGSDVFSFNHLKTVKSPQPKNALSMAFFAFLPKFHNEIMWIINYLPGAPPTYDGTFCRSSSEICSSIILLDFASWRATLKQI